MFEIEFVDLKGNTRRKIVPNHRIAREVARSLAIAIGRRAIVRKRDTRWNMLLIDLDSHSIVQVCSGYSKSEAKEFWDSWDFENSNAIVLPWPDTIAPPI